MSAGGMVRERSYLEIFGVEGAIITSKQHKKYRLCSEASKTQFKLIFIVKTPFGVPFIFNLYTHSKLLAKAI